MVRDVGVKVQGINIEHFEINGLDIGLSGNFNFLTPLILGALFYLISEIKEFGTITGWFGLIGILLILLSAALIIKRIKRALH